MHGGVSTKCENAICSPKPPTENGKPPDRTTVHCAATVRPLCNTPRLCRCAGPYMKGPRLRTVTSERRGTLNGKGRSLLRIVVRKNGRLGYCLDADGVSSVACNDQCVVPKIFKQKAPMILMHIFFFMDLTPI